MNERSLLVLFASWCPMVCFEDRSEPYNSTVQLQLARARRAVCSVCDKNWYRVHNGCYDLETIPMGPRHELNGGDGSA